MKVEFIYDETSYSYIICEKDIQYTMPHAYTFILKEYLATLETEVERPIESWFNSLKAIEKVIVEKKVLQNKSTGKNKSKIEAFKQETC